MIKQTFITLCLLVLSIVGYGQANDSVRAQYVKWSVMRDSIHWDSIYNYYSDFRKDTNGSKGLRLKYYKGHSFCLVGLNEKKVIELLGKPNDTSTIKGDIGIVQKKTISYDMGSEVTKRDSTGSEGCNYRIIIHFFDGKVMYPPYDIDYFPAPWVRMGMF